MIEKIIYNRNFLCLPVLIVIFFAVMHSVTNLYGETNAFLFDPPAVESPDIFEVSAVSFPEEVERGGHFSIEITIKVPAGYKLYADKTSIEPIPAGHFIFGKIISPPPIIYSDPYIGEMNVFQGDVTFVLPVQIDASAVAGPSEVQLKANYQGCSDHGCLMPRTVNVQSVINVIHPLHEPDRSQSAGYIQKMNKDTVDKDLTDNDKNPFQKAADRFGLIGVVLAAFLLGFTTSLTPCVYPMIPVTVSVIGSKSSGNILQGFILSVFYVFGLSLTYAIFGTLAAVSGGLFGAISGNAFVRIIVALVFVLMALSMFDIFFIQMPSSVSSKLNKISIGGFWGVFVTGAVSGLIVGPCVGPMLVGLLIYIAGLGNILKGFLIMWSFAIGMGVLFLIIGTFSGAISALPKAGNWMEKVKQFFGLMMLAVAVYFIAPLVDESVLKLFIGALFVLSGVFSGAFDALKSDSTGSDRLWKAIGIFFIVLGAGYILSFSFKAAYEKSLPVSIKSGLLWHDNEESALTLAKEQKKPVVIDFAADWCSACKRIDKNTFSSQNVLSELQRFVLLKIDCTDSNDDDVKRLLKKYDVVGLPSILFVHSDGNIDKQKRITSYIGPDDFFEILRTIE